MTLTEAIGDAIFETSNWIQLRVEWQNGTRTVFERDRGSLVWTMQGRDGSYRMVYPSFAYDGGGFTIGFPTTRTMYYLFDDRTGHFGNETLVWEFVADPDFSRGTISGANYTADLPGALSRYSLILIRVNWPDGGTTDFYRQGDGTWRMNGRDGGFTSVNPSFTILTNQLNISFPGSSLNYIMHEGGHGARGSESFTWSYSFTSH